LRHLHNAIDIPPLGAHPFLHPSSKMAPPDSFVSPSVAILTMPEQQENGLQDCLTDGRKRWEQLVAKDLSHEQPSRYKHGVWTVAYSLTRKSKPVALRDMRQILKQTEDHRIGKDGFPVWAVTADELIDLDTHPYNDFLECWMGKDPDLDSVYSHFWWASPEGSLFLLRGYQEDCEPKIPPGTILWLETPISQIGEILLHSHRLAKALGDEEGSISLCVVWEGLADRNLSSRRDPIILGKRLVQAKCVCHQRSASSRFIGSIKDIPINLAEIVETITRPLYQRFNFCEPSPDLIRKEISELTKNRL